MKIVCIIPARYNSKRLPGKPLLNIAGKPMIKRVFERVEQMNLFKEIYVATDHTLIFNYCKSNNINVIITPDTCISGTDRVSIAAEKIQADAIVIIMGDEPFIEKQDIQLLIDKYIQNQGKFVIALMRKIKEENNITSNSVIKVVVDNNDNLLYLSRAPIPYAQTSIDVIYKKILGCYIFPDNIIKQHKNLKVGLLEKIEALDSFRLLENGIKIKCYETNSNYFSIDTQKDLDYYNNLLKEDL